VTIFFITGRIFGEVNEMIIYYFLSWLIFISVEKDLYSTKTIESWVGKKSMKWG